MKKTVIKARDYTCQECKNSWITKKEEFVCPECGSVYLDMEPLR